MASMESEGRESHSGASEVVEAPTGSGPEGSVVSLGWDAGVESVVLGFGMNAEPTPIDWSGSGRLDLLVTAEVGPRRRLSRIYRVTELDSDGPRYDSGTDLPELAGLRGLCPLPNGRPSRFDLVGLGKTGLVWLPNDGEPDQPKFGPRRDLGLPKDLGLGPGRVSQIVAADWDGDGRLDLLVGFDHLNDYWPEGNAIPEGQQQGFNQSAGHPSYDPQGHWRGQPVEPKLYWLHNQGEPGLPRFAPPEELETGERLDPKPRPAPLLVAWNGPGSWEFLLADAEGFLRRFRNFGGQRPPVLMEPSTLRFQGQPFTLPEDRTTLCPVNLDGSHREGLLFGRADGRVFAIHPGKNRDEIQEPKALTTQPGALWIGGGAVLAATDLDNDGDLDLVVGDASGRLHYFEDLGQPGDHAYAAPLLLEAGGEPFRIDPGPDGTFEGPVAPRLGFACPAIADWNGNGRPDLLVSGSGGEVLFLRNNGAVDDPRFDSARPIRRGRSLLYTPPRVRPALADWNGQGQLDLISLDLQGFLCVYPRLDTMDVGDPIPLVDRLGRLIRLDGGFGLAGRCSLWAGPFLGTDRLDILVGLHADSRPIVPGLVGEPFESLDEIPTVILLENLGNNVLVPRPIRLRDGRPLHQGAAGCSPCGVSAPDGSLGLLLGSEDGTIRYLAREDLRW